MLSLTAQATALGVRLPDSDDELDAANALMTELHGDGDLPADRPRLRLLAAAARVVGRTLLAETDRTDDGVRALRLSTLASFLAGPDASKRHEDHAVLAATYHLLGMDDEATAELHAADTAAQSSGDGETWSATASLAPDSFARDDLLRNLPWFESHLDAGPRLSEDERLFEWLTDEALTQDGLHFPTLARSVADEIITTDSLPRAEWFTDRLLALFPLLDDPLGQELLTDTAAALAGQSGGELLAAKLYDDLVVWHREHDDVTGQITALTGAGAAYLASDHDDRLTEAFTCLDSATTLITSTTDFSVRTEAKAQLALLYLEDNQPEAAVRTLAPVVEHHPYPSLADADEVRARARLLVLLSESCHAAAAVDGPQQENHRSASSAAMEEARRGFDAVGEGGGYEKALADFRLPE